MHPRLEHESDPQILRNAVRLLVNENDVLLRKLQAALSKNAALTGKDQAIALAQMELLKEQLAAANRKLYGASSEQRSASDEPPAPDAAAPVAKQKGHGPTPQPALPRIEVLHNVANDDASCSACGSALAIWEGHDETSDEITVVERTFVVHVHRRPKLRCACGSCIKVAPAPPKVRENGRYSAAFAVSVAISKYLDHLPLERQCRIMARQGLTVTSQTLWDQIEGLATWLQPAWVRLGAHQRTTPLLHVDETPWRMADRGNRPSRWWAWVSRSEDGAYFEIKDSRSKDAGSALLAGYTGRVMSDGYAAYHAMHKAALRECGKSFTHAHCWSHVRRKFIELETTFPAEAKEALKRIDAIFALEREFPEHRTDDPTLQLRAKMRTERSAPLIASLGAWLHALQPLPQSGLGKAVQYTANLWQGLILFLADPRIPLSNNAAERVVRGPVVGRKNYYGARSERGCQVAAILYSLLESAKLCNIEPSAYLRGAIAEALAGTTARLPHEIRAAQDHR